MLLTHPFTFKSHSIVMFTLILVRVFMGIAVGSHTYSPETTFPALGAGAGCSAHSCLIAVWLAAACSPGITDTRTA